MAKRFKYSEGIVVLKGGDEIVLKAHELKDEGIRIKYKDAVIFDPSKTYRLFIRSRGESSHFYARGRSRKNIRSEQYRSELHNETISSLENYLSKKERVRLLYYAWEYKKKHKETITSIKDYLFQKDVKQICGEASYIVFDLFGISNNLTSTNNKPQVAFEIVDTHFCDKETFNTLLDLSVRSSLVVLFYYAKHAPKRNQMHNIGENNNGEIRVQHYIQDGSFWVGDERIEEKDYSYLETYNTATDFNNSDQYYRAVRELEVDKLL